MAREAGNVHDPGAPVGHREACRRCGACCANVACPPFVPEEMAELPRDIRNVVDWFRGRDPDRGPRVIPCYFLNIATRRCLIYEHRPQACREFKPGGQVCKELRWAFVACLDRFNEDMRTRH